MFEILMYLFENYMEGNIVLKADQDTIVHELEQAGFHIQEIDRALAWLSGLTQMQETIQPPALPTQAIRHYSPDECEHIGIEGRGFLLYLEQMKVLDAFTREVVIDRLMALEPREIDISRIRWVVLIALFNQPEKKAALLLLQDMIMSDAFDVLH